MKPYQEQNDRTWPLYIGFDVEGWEDISFRVRGDYTIGMVMGKISQQMEETNDWSDYALWWPANKRWLKQFKMTLDQVDVIANTKLIFTSMHKPLRIQYPDLNIEERNVDFSVNVLKAVAELCQEIDISHPEELSFARPLSNSQLKRNNPNLKVNETLQRARFDTLSPKNVSYNNDTMNQSSGSLMSNTSYKSLNTMSSNGSMNGSSSSLTSTESRDSFLPHPKSSVQKARLNSAWLNSSLSLYEQDVCPNDLLLLKFKFYTFFDLNATQLSRVNYLYEHLKWAILKEEIYCTEDEMYTLAGIMSRVNECSGINRTSNSNNNNNNNNNNKSNNNVILEKNIRNGKNSVFTLSSGPQNGSHSPKVNGINGQYHHHNNHYNHCHENGQNGNGMLRDIDSLKTISSNGSSNNEVDSELEKLERQLEGTGLEMNCLNGQTNGKRFTEQNSVIVVPHLAEQLKISCQKIRSTSSTLSRFKFKFDKTYNVYFRETTLQAFKPQSEPDSRPNEPAILLKLTNCEVNPDVLASQQKYCFQIIAPTPKGSMEYVVKCQDENQYAKWFNACKQASLGRTMAHHSYQEQYNNTLKLLKIQSKFSGNIKYNKDEIKSLSETIDVNSIVSRRFIKRASKEQILAKIKAAHQMFANESLVEAQMNFIRTCQTLKDFAIHLFVVRFEKSKQKKELLGVMPDKLALIDLNGTLKKSWRYKLMINWNINWEVKRMRINFHDESIEFECLSADCKVIHEFIGGYIYMSMREKGKYDQFDEEQFLRLAGGWNDDFETEDQHIAMCKSEAFVNKYSTLMMR